MTRVNGPAAYVEKHFADAPTEWIVGEIARISTAIAESGQHVEWRRGIVAAYLDVLTERGAKALADAPADA